MYDSTWKYGVTKDLREIGQMPIFINNFMNNKNFRVQLGDTLSTQKEQEMSPTGEHTISHTIEHKDKQHHKKHRCWDRMCCICG